MKQETRSRDVAQGDCLIVWLVDLWWGVSRRRWATGILGLRQRDRFRTVSTALWLSKSEDGKWRLSKYLDKPIE
jgi:hypothetical protein